MSGPPAAVRVFEGALADWLSSFTAPEALAGEMADVCGEGAAWAAAIAGVSARRVGWGDPEAMAWGLCVGGLAAALEAARRSLAAPGGAAGADTPPARAAALPLLASDGLVAAAHEALGSLDPARARDALAALAGGFGDGGPWRRLAEDPGAADWPELVPCALAVAAAEEPSGPWSSLARAWADRAAADPRELWDHPGADPDTRDLLRAAARAAREASPGGRRKI